MKTVSNKVIELVAERDKYKEDYEVSFAEWHAAVKTIEDWKDRWTKANEIYKDLLAANTVLRAALQMYAGNRSPEWRLIDNGELAEQTLRGLTELQSLQWKPESDFLKGPMNKENAYIVVYTPAGKCSWDNQTFCLTFAGKIDTLTLSKAEAKDLADALQMFLRVAPENPV
jgi:hypothetical protein